MAKLKIPNITKQSLAAALGWLISRVAVIYFIVFIFSMVFVDLKTLNMRTEVRHLNQAVPGFLDMINFSMGKNGDKKVNWIPCKKYFELILRYLPDDLIAKQLLGYVDYYSGDEQKSIALLKSSADLKGHLLFWSNYNLGVIYYKKGLWPQAAEYLFKAVSSNSRLTLILMQDSLVYKQILSGLPSYNPEDGINQAKSNAYILLLSCLYHMGQFDKMIEVYNLSMANQELSYKDAFYYYAGLSFYETGQMDKAILLFQKSLTIEKNNPDVYFFIGSIYQKTGQLELAKDFLQASLALHQKNDPRFPYEAKINLRFL